MTWIVAVVTSVLYPTITKYEEDYKILHAQCLITPPSLLIVRVAAAHAVRHFYMKQVRWFKQIPVQRQLTGQ